MTAIPASCLLCDDGSCGAPVCVGGKFDHFECADDGGSGGAAGGGGAGSGDPGDDPCDLIDCRPGTHCELIEVQCIRAPCPAQPECRPN